MSKYHINANGRVAVCKAEVRACPLGEANHFDSITEASSAAQNRNAKQFGVMAGASNEPEAKKFDTKSWEAETIEVEPGVKFSVSLEHKGYGDYYEINYAMFEREGRDYNQTKGNSFQVEITDNNWARLSKDHGFEIDNPDSNKRSFTQALYGIVVDGTPPEID